MTSQSLQRIRGVIQDLQGKREREREREGGREREIERARERGRARKIERKREREVQLAALLEIIPFTPEPLGSLHILHILLFLLYLFFIIKKERENERGRERERSVRRPARHEEA